MKRVLAFMIMFIIAAVATIISFFGIWQCDACGKWQFWKQRNRVEKYDGVNEYCNDCKRR